MGDFVMDREDQEGDEEGEEVRRRTRRRRRSGLEEIWLVFY